METQNPPDAARPRLTPLDGAARPRPVPPTDAARRYSRADVAAELGVSVDAVKRLQRRADVPGELVPAAHGGRVCMVTAGDLAALRLAAAELVAPDAAERRPTPPTDAARREPAPPAAARPTPPDAETGWREAVALATAEADRLRSQLEVANAARQEALRRAEAAEVARHTALEQREALRAAWWRWYALATARGLWARLRGRLPDPPAEMTADRLLTG